MSTVPVVDMQWCTYRKEYKELILASEYCGMPALIDVRSNHTGRVVRFRPIGENHPLFDQDGWDGEQAVYEPLEYLPNVNVLTIVNYF